MNAVFVMVNAIVMNAMSVMKILQMIVYRIVMEIGEVLLKI